MVIPKPISQIIAENPLPWREAVRGNTIYVIDSQGKEVGIFSMTAFLEQITNHMARNPPKPAPAPETSSTTG